MSATSSVPSPERATSRLVPASAVRRAGPARRSAPAVAAALGLLLHAAPGRAQPFATPPGTPSRTPVVVVQPGGDPDGEPDPRAELPPVLARPSFVHLSVGPAAKLGEGDAAPGLMAALDLGRGAAGFRLAGAWMDVGKPAGLSQYTGELTLDFGGRSAVRPVVAAGGGVARTSSSVRDDGTKDEGTGATLGVAVVRAGVGFRLPFEDADARVALDLTGTLPAIRSARAPDLSPWLVTSITVGIGF